MLVRREEARAGNAAQKEAEKQARAQERTMARAERGGRLLALFARSSCIHNIHVSSASSSN